MASMLMSVLLAFDPVVDKNLGTQDRCDIQVAKVYLPQVPIYSSAQKAG